MRRPGRSDLASCRDIPTIDEADQVQPPARAASERRERGNARESQRHPPHLTENDQEADRDRRDGPVLPANASGSDRVPARELERPIDGESMYDDRPSQDKDRPPSGGVR